MVDEILSGVTQFYYRREALSGQYSFVPSDPSGVLGVSMMETEKMLCGEAMEQVHPGDRSAYEEAFSRLGSGCEEQLTHEFRLQQQAASTYATYIWVRHTARAVRENGGVRIEGVVANITETWMMKAEIRGLRARYEHLWKQAGAAVCQSRFDGRALLSCNERMAMLLGYHSAEECVAQLAPADTYVDPECRPRLMAQLRHCTTMEGIEIEFRRKDREHIWLRMSFCKHTNGEALDIVAADITAKKLLSASEMQVLRHLLAGLSNKEIANRLSRSLRTVENHRAAIMAKLGVKTSIELAKRAVTCELD